MTNSKKERVRAIAVDCYGRLLFGVTKLQEYRLVGGGVEEGESAEEALRRELKEEAGVVQIDNMVYLFDAYDNKVFKVDIRVGSPLTSFGDPDEEFERLELVAFNSSYPPPLDDFSEAILFTWLLRQRATAGKMQVFCDDEMVMEFDDDVIWQTMPRLAQLKSSGKQLTFKQRSDDGQTHNFALDTMPAYFEDFRRVRVMGIDTGLLIHKTSKIEGVKINFGDSIELITDGNANANLIVPNSSQLSLDMSMLTFGDLQITTNHPVDEASAIALELLRDHFPDEDSEPEVVIVSSGDFVAATRFNPESGHVYIALTDLALKSNNLRQILAHEIIHYYLYKQLGSLSVGTNEHHDELYLELAEEINKTEGEDFITPFADNTRWKLR